MVKRAFKNKRLMRSILILAGLVIVGFFIWTMLFKNTKIFEGQTIQPTPFDAAVEKCAGRPFDGLRDCMIENLANVGITREIFDSATSGAQNAPEGIIMQNEVIDQLRAYMNTNNTTRTRPRREDEPPETEP
jgi:hypothetical protein